MAKLKDYDKSKVVLKDEILGCIPWSIEWMITYKHYITKKWVIPEGDLSNFQKYFNLQVETKGKIKNYFSTIMDEIDSKYGDIGLIRNTDYGNGEGIKKFDKIEKIIDECYPVTIPVKLSPFLPAHIMPIYEIDKNEVNVINRITSNYKIETLKISRNTLINIHENGYSREFIYLKI